MSKFKKAKLKQIIEYKSGYTWSKEQESRQPGEGSTRVLTVTNIREKLDLKSELYLHSVSDRDKNDKAVSKDWTIAVSSNGNRKRIGNAVFIDDDTEYLFASFLTAFKPKAESDILPKFFYYWLSLDKIQEEISAVSEGTTGLGNLDIRYLRNMEIHYPENPMEQAAIVGVLSKVDEATAAFQSLIESAERVKKSLMQNLLSGKRKSNGESRSENDFSSNYKFGKVPKDWKCGQLSDIAEIIAGQSPAGDTYNDEGDGVPVLNGPTEFTDLYPIAVQHTTKPTRFCRKGDILFTVRGSTTGRMNHADQEYCIGRGIAAIRANENSDNDFLYYVLVKIAHLILAEAKGAGSTFPNVNKNELLKKKIIFPPEKTEQEAISKRIKNLENLIRTKQTKVLMLGRLKKSLMQNLLMGKITVDVNKVQKLLAE